MSLHKMEIGKKKLSIRQLATHNVFLLICFNKIVGKKLFMIDHENWQLVTLFQLALISLEIIYI